MLTAQSVVGRTSQKLEGTPIGTVNGYQYEPYGRVVENIQSYAFDGDPLTYFATDQRSYGWVGLDLGEPCVITRAGWMPRNDGVGPDRVVTAVLQGANSEDFMDAVPLYIITERGVIGQMTYDDIDCSRAFRYSGLCLRAIRGAT